MRSRARVRSGNGRRARVGRLSRLLGLYAMLTASAWAMSARAQSTTAAGTPIRFISAPDLSAYYPAASRRIGEQGRAVVRVCVSAGGAIDSAEIASSTGSARLDEAALAFTRAVRFQPAVSNGAPVSACMSFAVKFELHEPAAPADAEEPSDPQAP